MIVVMKRIFELERRFSIPNVVFTTLDTHCNTQIGSDIPIFNAIAFNMEKKYNMKKKFNANTSKKKSSMQKNI